MTFISYAQNYEDVMLHRALKDVDRGFYIDVGANDPIIDSVTKAFYDVGWRGINIEPVNEWYEKLQQDRPDDINLKLAVGARKGEINFYEVVGTGLSTMDESIAKRHAQEHGFEIKRYKIPVVRLTTICEQYPHSDIHFLKIDVEGAELSVLQGFDLKKIRPWIILVESTLPNSQIENHEEWEHSVADRGYHYVYFDGLNRYYVADEHGELDNAFMVPPNYFDFFKRASEDWLERHAQWLKSEWDATKTSFNQMEETVERVESNLQETKQQRQQLEKQVQALLAEVGQNHERLHEKETKQQELLLSMVEKETRLQEAATTLADNKQEIDKLQASLADSKAHQQLIETILQETKQQRQQLEKQVQVLQAEVGQHHERLREKETKQQELLLSMVEKETRLQEAATTLTDNKQEIDKLHASLADSKAHQQSIETILQETKQQRQQLEKQVQALQAEVEQHHERLREKETKQQELLLSMVEKETRLQEAATTLTDNKQEIDKLQASLADSKAQQQAIEITLQETKQQRQQLETEVQRLQTEAGQRDEQLREKEGLNNWLNNEWETAKQKIDELHQSNHHWWSMTEQQGKELEETRAKIDELNQSSHHWWLEADRLNKELQTVYNSKSWRITWPLRKLMQLFKWLFCLPGRLMFWLIRLPKRAARWLLVKSMLYALKHTGLKGRAMPWLRNYPNLKTKLRRLAQESGLLTTQMAASPMPPQPVTESNEAADFAAELPHLTPRARLIYRELIAARAQLHKDND